MAPLFIAGAVSHLGWLEGRLPDILIIAAQVVIGSALGAQFRPEFLTRLFRLLLAAAEPAAPGGFDGRLRRSGGVARRLFGPTMVLAVAPAGIAQTVSPARCWT